MSATSRRPGGGGTDPAAVIGLAAGTVVLPANPFQLVIELGTGTRAWPPAATWLLALLVSTVLLLALPAALAASRWRRRRSRVDRAARHMGRGKDLHALNQRGAAASASRLGVHGSVGLPVGETVAGGQRLYASYEDASVDIWGPRTGKTTSRAVPAILDAPGAVLATSNKRDLVDATRDPRAAAGQVWVFDPQQIVDELTSWWWNPLTYVTDEVKASVLAGVFAAASAEPGARSDAYFESRGQRLLADMLLAAALGSRPLSQVYLWLTNPTDDEPAAILRGHGYPLNAASVDEAVNMADRQRSGVYGAAQKIVAFMTNRQAMSWVSPDGGSLARRQFQPAAFVRGRGTLYSLSKEGPGSAGALVTALTVAVCEAAEDLAKRSPAGRLPVPMVAVLDEAANVCRWRELPNLYSHYGSRGICVLTILQSWSQGVEVWGRDGMRKLWSAATVKVYGGGVAEGEFLSELSQLIGDDDLQSVSTSRGKSGRSTSRSTRRERVMDIADLTSLSRGRAVLFTSGAPATLIRTLPWMTGPHATAVAASIRAHDPVANSTLDDARTAAAAADLHVPAGRGAP